MVKGKNDRTGRKIEVDDTEITIRSDPVDRSRPEYRCARCEITFPSQLDLSEGAVRADLGPWIARSG